MAVPMKLAKITREALFFPLLGASAESDAEDMESPLSLLLEWASLRGSAGAAACRDVRRCVRNASSRGSTGKRCAVPDGAGWAWRKL
jgi:hypothetical protein